MWCLESLPWFHWPGAGFTHWHGVGEGNGRELLATGIRLQSVRLTRFILIFLLCTLLHFLTNILNLIYCIVNHRTYTHENTFLCLFVSHTSHALCYFTSRLPTFIISFVIFKGELNINKNEYFCWV